MSLLRRIQAFTLAEILIGLVISGIVVTLSFTVLTIFTKYMQSVQSGFAIKNEIRRFEQQFAVDFAAFPNLRYNPLDKKLRFNSPIDSLQYTFGHNFITRRSDTILIATNTCSFYYLGAEITKGKIDAVKISIANEKNPISLFFYKTNDAQQLLTQDGD